MAHSNSLGLYLAVCGTSNTIDANIKGRTAAAGSFRYPGRGKTRRGVIVPDLMRRFVGLNNRNFSRLNLMLSKKEADALFIFPCKFGLNLKESTTIATYTVRIKSVVSS